MFSKRKCEKCGKIFPKGYSEPLCENCKGKRAAGIKKVGVAIAGLAVAGSGVALAVIKGVLKK